MVAVKTVVVAARGLGVISLCDPSNGTEVAEIAWDQLGAAKLAVRRFDEAEIAFLKNYNFTWFIVGRALNLLI